MQLKKLLLECFAFNCIFLHLILCAQIENKKDDILNQTKQVFEAKSDLTGRSLSKQPARKKLPAGDIFSNLELNNLKCDGTYSVVKEYYAFSLDNTFNSKNKPCQYNFVGSRNEKCTVAILCNEKVSLAPPSSKGCDKEFLVISDGTEGLMTGCGTFSFSNAPRIARNNGSDLYFYIKGSSPTRCIAFCLEQLETEASHPGINPPKKISKNKLFEGFRMETGCKCGVRRDKGRIVGRRARTPFCGGSLVNDRYFISAAHCFQGGIEPKMIQVILHSHLVGSQYNGDDENILKIPGATLPEETDESEDTIRMDVQEIRNHPLFDIKTYDYDIAILKFTRAVNLKRGKVAPVCLAYMKELFSYEDGTNMVVAGWGLTWESSRAGARLLQKLDVPFLNYADCRKLTVPTKRHICLGYQEGGKDACSGDSGGPAIYKFNNENNQYLLSGLVSAGIGCARKGKLGLYSDVQELLQWAYQHMPDAVYCPRGPKSA